MALRSISNIPRTVQADRRFLSLIDFEFGRISEALKYITPHMR